MERAGNSDARRALAADGPQPDVTRPVVVQLRRRNPSGSSRRDGGGREFGPTKSATRAESSVDEVAPAKRHLEGVAIPIDEAIERGHHGVVARFRRLFEPPAAADPPDERLSSTSWSSFRSFARSHPQIVDAGIAFLIAVAGLVSLAVNHPIGAAPWLLTCVLAAPLVWRRRCPTIVFLVLAAIGFVQWLLDLQLAADLALLVGLFTVADERPRRVAIGAATVLELGALLATIRWVPVETSIRSIVFLSGLVLAAVLSGANVRARRAHVTSLVERAERLEIERDQQAQLAAAAERSRIAREMHDVIAHSLAVIVALADGASAKLHRDPEQASSALSSVSALGRQTLDDTRRLLGVLRTNPPVGSFRPQPGVGEIADLVDQVTATGLRAELRIEGEAFPVAPGPGLSAYRIVQEAITNALKHARGATSVLVELGYHGRNLEIEVRDDGQPAAAVGPSQPGGFGLQGMRERAAIYDGTVSAGPTAGGGWLVHVSLAITDTGVRDGSR